MNIKPELKGYFFALVSLIAMSNVYIFSKAALKEIALPQFGIYWFGIALFFILLLAIYRKTFKAIITLPKKTVFILLLLAVIDVAGTYFFYRAIQSIENPSIVAFIGNISPALVILLSIIIFSERFNALETIGIVLALTGAFIISYKGNLGLKDMFVYGTQFVVISSLLSATNAIIIKHNIKKVSPIILTLNRTVFLFLFFLITFPWQTMSLEIPLSALKNTAFGAFIGPFLTAVAGFMVYKYLPVSRKAIVDSMRGLVVLIGAYIYFGSFPSTTAVVGGLISIVGVLFIAFGKLRLKEKG